MSFRQIAPVAAIAALALGLVLALLVISPPAGTKLNNGILLDKPREIREFSLQDAHGETFSRERLEGRWTALFPGFTHCPDICPATLGMLSAAVSALDEGTREQWQIVFLSVDPERDTPDALRQYLGYFSQDFIGATGETRAIDGLTRDLAVAYQYTPTGDDSYTVDHTTAIVLINPAGQVAGYIQPPFRPDELSADMRIASGRS